MYQHIILTNGRSGSNSLVNLLNLHPQVTNYGEVLGEWTTLFKLYNKLKPQHQDYQAYLDYLYTSQSFFYLAQAYSAYAKLTKKNKPNFKFYHHIKTIGIKDFSINFVKRDIFDYLKKRDILVINLYRDNPLKRAISLEAMTKTKVVAIVEQEKSINKNQKTYLPTENILEKLDIFAKEKEDQFIMIDGLPNDRVLNIAYEDYFESNDSQEKYNQKIFNFLKVEELLLKTNHRKILSNKLVDSIENYNEIVKILKNTQYQKYLDE